jgi:hypothetical protein
MGWLSRKKVWRLIRPDLTKVGLALILPLIIGGLLTLSFDGALGFYGLMLTLGDTMYADVTYFQFNYFVLFWVPIYFFSCIIVQFSRTMVRARR